MLAVVCQAIFFDFFLENPGFLEKGVPWRVDVQFYVSPFPPLPVVPGDRAEPLVDVVLDRDSRKRRDGQRDHGRSVDLATWSNDDAHLHLSPGFEDPSWPVVSASTSWHVVMGSVERDRPQEPHFCHVSCSICHAHLSIMLFARASKVRIGSLPRRGDHGRYEPDKQMECGNALDCWCEHSATTKVVRLLGKPARWQA